MPSRARACPRISGPSLWLALALILLAASGTWGHSPSPPKPWPAQAPRSVLILYAAGPHLPAYRKNVDAFMGYMEKAGFPTNNIHVEFLDLIRNDGQEYRRELGDLLRRKYPAGKIDIVVTVESQARDFLLKDNPDLLPGVPLVATLASDSMPGPDPGRRVTQVPTILDMEGTLGIARSLFPATKRVFVVLGDGEGERQWARDAKRQFAPLEGRLAFEYSGDMTYEETLERVSSLPPDSVVIYVAFYRDKTGRDFVPRDVAIAITRRANAPVFGVYDQILPLVVGGSMISYEEEGGHAAELALAILGGETPQDQPLVTLLIHIAPRFNWPQLQRWGVQDTPLPPGSLVIRRPVSPWDVYGEYIVGIAVFIALQSGLIVALLVARRRRKTAEASRQLAESRYRQVVDNANEAILVIKDGHIVFHNPLATTMVGYTSRELSQAPFISFVHPLDREAVLDRHQKRLTGLAVPSLYDVRIVDKAGGLRWFRINVVMIQWEGRPATLCFMTDITEQKAAQESLIDSETKLRAILDNSRDAIVVAQNGLHSWANQAYAQLFGYDKVEDLLGTSIMDVIAPQSRDDIQDKTRRRAAGEYVPNSYETRGLRRDGSQFDMEVNVSIYELKGERNTLAILRDISERKRMEEALANSEWFNRNLVEHIPQRIFLKDLDSVYISCNANFAREMGITPEELVGKSDFDFFPPEMAEQFRADDRSVMKGGSAISMEERFLVQGEERWARTTKVPFRDSQGKIIGVLGIFDNITERKLAEQEKARLEAQLRQAQKMEAIGTLAGGIAHDFNNILGAVLGFAEMAHDDALSGRVDPADLTQIIGSAQRAKELVKQILAFSRKQEPDLKPLSLNQSIQRARSILERTLPKMISIHLELAPDLAAVLADSTQMEQVLLNLASNAADAMPEGGRLSMQTSLVELGPEYCRQHLEVRPGPYVRLVVSDTGQGMDEITREHIFEPFYTTKDVGRGTGLGLSTVYGIVKNHGGHIHCRSSRGEGTSFVIDLPAQTAISAPEEREQPEPEADAPPRFATILLVDDEKPLRQLGERILSGRGYRVITAASGEEALEIYRARGRELDLVIMDLSMPGMGGQRAMREMAALDTGARFLVASGYAAQGQAPQPQPRGGVGYLAKPFRAADLLAAVAQALRAG